MSHVDMADECCHQLEVSNFVHMYILVMSESYHMWMIFMIYFMDLIRQVSYIFMFESCHIGMVVCLILM